MMVTTQKSRVLPRVFIGSSVEGRAYARALQQELKYDAEVTIWNQGVFKLNQTALQSLLAQLDHTDFAVFIFTPDDQLTYRGQDLLIARDNVIFELGLSLGKLGPNRAFFLKPMDFQELHIPTDLLGITAGEFQKRTDGNLQAAVGAFATELMEIMRREGRFAKHINDIMMKNSRLTAQSNFLYALIKNAKHLDVKFNRIVESFLMSCQLPPGFIPSAATCYTSIDGEELVQIGYARDVDEENRFKLDHNERFPDHKSYVVESFLTMKSVMGLKEQAFLDGKYEYVICFPIAQTYVFTIHLLTENEVPAEAYSSLLVEITEMNKAIINTFNVFLERSVETYESKQQPSHQL
ncbi:MAG TPA: nucleotide-binding protein [Candidatus Bathyarchaeia archaeon]|nr:nucleotide-binding protein [Candidatus Bathyarchaeia archaeon]